MVCASSAGEDVAVQRSRNTEVRRQLASVEEPGISWKRMMVEEALGEQRMESVMTESRSHTTYVDTKCSCCACMHQTHTWMCFF